MEEIINKVAQSSLMVFDLEDYFPEQKIVAFDISVFLWEGIMLKEKEFRKVLSYFDWTDLNHKIVCLYCSTDAILPAWAFSLVAIQLQPIATEVFHGTTEEFLIAHYSRTLHSLDFSEFENKPVILKGCSKKEVPQKIYVLALNKLQKMAKSIMFGEACSAVPLYKNKN